jgi:hypothetical protein
MLPKSIFNFKWVYLFFICAGIYLSIAYITNTFILTDAFYYSAFGDQISTERVSSFIQFNRKCQWAGYVLMPILLLLKWAVIGGIIFAGSFLFNQNLSFKNCFKIVILAELVLILIALIKLFYFFIYKPETLEAIQYFSPLSITQFFNLNNCLLI